MTKPTSGRPPRPTFWRWKNSFQVTLRRELARVPPDLRPHPDNPPLWQKALSYHRQYAGVLNHRRQVIAGNFFCSDVQRDWHKELVEVVGGGDCFFGIKYDVEDRRIFDLWINADK